MEPFKKYTAYTDETPTVATVGTLYCHECKTHDGFKDNVVIEGAVRCYNCGAGREQEPEEQETDILAAKNYLSEFLTAYQDKMMGMPTPDAFDIINHLKEKFTITRKQ